MTVVAEDVVYVDTATESERLDPMAWDKPDEILTNCTEKFIRVKNILDHLLSGLQFDSPSN